MSGLSGLSDNSSSKRIQPHCIHLILYISNANHNPALTAIGMSGISPRLALFRLEKFGAAAEFERSRAYPRVDRWQLEPYR